MERTAALLLASTLLSACSFSFPVNGIFEGEPAQGTATAALSGGTFNVYATNGQSCSGTYDANTNAITITGPVTCSDGRTGNVIITRKSNLVSGTAIVRLNDGSTGQFVFGDLSYAEEFNI